jgi:hypothetical protein
MPPIITMPDVPQLGVPEGVKQAGQRVDFKPDQFDLAIETKGYLLLWERAALCPCTPVATQTEQPDPNCTLCHGHGWLYFGASEAQVLTNYTLTELQQQMLDDSEGMIIRGVITSITEREDPVDKISRWVEGTANLTVRYGNRIGYYDKLTMLDAEIVFSEIIETDGTNILPTRYPVVGVNQLRSVSKIYNIGVDFHINKGVIEWLPGYIPSSEIRLAIHYLCHPVWLVVEHPHAARVTLRKMKTPSPTTPTGDARQLPIQAMIRYDFLPEPT